jgi:hypothetical protein
MSTCLSVVIVGMVRKEESKNTVQCPPLNIITFSRHKNGNNNLMIQLTAFLSIIGLAMFDYNELLILLSVIPLSGEHFVTKMKATLYDHSCTQPF